MDSTFVNGNCNNNNEMKKDLGHCTVDKVYVYETAIGGEIINEELYNTDNQKQCIHKYVAVKDENMDNQTVIDLIDENSCDVKYKQGNIHNYVSIKDENIDDLKIVIPETELRTDCTDTKLCPNATVSRGGYIKQEPGDIKDEQKSIQDYPNIKDENMDDLTVVVEGTELVSDCIDNKVCIYETIISGQYIKHEPCKQEDKSGSIQNNVDIKDCEECGEEYDLYCLNCPMLIRIFDSNNLHRTDGTIRRTLPKNFLDICEPQSGMGVVALRAIPEGVVFGPFKGVVLIKDDDIWKWKLQNNKLAVNKDSKRVNWMQYIRRADKSSHQNLVSFQYEDGLYYRTKCHINMGDELLVHWDIDDKETENQDMEDSYWGPQVYESLDDSYACTFCCVGFKSLNHLKAHNSTCVAKRNKKDFCEEIVPCDICKIYLDKKEYFDYHVDRCNKNAEKCVFNPRYRRNGGRRVHNGDRSFASTLCPYKATTKSDLKQHIAIHNGDKPFGCTLCLYKAPTKQCLKRHMSVHNDDRPFACTLCPYKTTTNWNLKRHLAVHNDDKPFVCTLCPYKALTESNLKKHIAIHNDDKPFECTLCTYKTATNSILKRHMAVHNDDRPFVCTLCPYKTTTSWNLKRHMAIHNDDKPFVCTLCSYKATIKSNLKHHIAVHHGDRSLTCTLCPYKTKRKSYLKKHIASHNGNKL